MLLGPWGFSRQEHSSGLPCPPLGDLPNPGIKPRSPILQADSLPSEPPGKPLNVYTNWPWCLEGLGAGGEWDDRGWDGWMASPTWWAWVWVNSGSLWWMEAWRAAIHGVAKSQTRLTELNWTELHMRHQCFTYQTQKEIWSKQSNFT